MKVFCIGLQRTGSTSLQTAITDLGFTFCAGQLHLAKEVEQQNFEAVYELVDKYEAFKDVPYFLMYKELDQKYPGSKFILTVRDSDKWLKSVLNYWPIGAKDRQDHRKIIYGASNPNGNEELYLEKFTSHIEEVENYFSKRKNDLLVFDVTQGDGWDKLCSFLNKPMPKHLGLIPKKFPLKQRAPYSDLGAVYFKFRSLIAKLVRR